SLATEAPDGGEVRHAVRDAKRIDENELVVGPRARELDDRRAQLVRIRRRGAKERNELLERLNAPSLRRRLERTAGESNLFVALRQHWLCRLGAFHGRGSRVVRIESCDLRGRPRSEDFVVLLLGDRRERPRSSGAGLRLRRRSVRSITENTAHERFTKP